jgi:prefoldin subunit 5
MQGKAIMSNQDDITAAIAGIRSRLDTLASINEANILIPGGPQERYHAIVEEAYAALGLIETQVDELRTELEYQHKRLDEIRDAQRASTSQEKELGVDAEDASRRAHEDWANDE